MAHFDTLIRGGTVIDGTGIPRFRADVGIVRDGRIAKIDGIRDATADRVLRRLRVLRRTGLHRHPHALRRPDPLVPVVHVSAGWHGVTTVVLGNCGFGFAPVPPPAA